MWRPGVDHGQKHELRDAADSGERDQPFRSKVITDSGDRDHLDPLGGGPG